MNTSKKCQQSRNCRRFVILLFWVATLFMPRSSEAIVFGQSFDIQGVTYTSPYTGGVPTIPTGSPDRVILTTRLTQPDCSNEIITITNLMSPPNACQVTKGPTISNYFPGTTTLASVSQTWVCYNFTQTPTSIFFTDIATATCPGTNTNTFIATNELDVVGCPLCVGCSIGSGSAGNNSVEFSINLGPGNSYNQAGILMLYADTPSTALGTPSALQVPVNPSQLLTFVNNVNGLEEVVAPLGLFLVTNVMTSQYNLQYYTNGSFTGPDGSGFYSPGTNLPYTTYVVTNLYNNANSDVLTITQEQSGLASRVFQYTYTNGGTNQMRWDLLQPDGTTVSKWYYTVTNYTTNTFWQTSAGSNILSQIVATTQYIPSVGLLFTNQVVNGVGSITETTTYTYYPTNASVGSSNQLEEIDYPNGNWVYNLYDTIGRVTNAYSAYNNSAPPSPGTIPDVVSNQCKLVVYDYTPIAGTVDDGSVLPFSPRTTTTILPSAIATGGKTEVMRTYDVIGPNFIEEELAANPGAPFATAGNVRSVTTNYDSTSSPASAGRIKAVSRPDGSASVFTYSTNAGSLIIVEAKGAPDSWQQPTTILDGTKTTTTIDALGRDTTNIVIDIATSNIISYEVYSYSAGDPFGQTYTLTDELSGLSYTYAYGCCGLEDVTDPDGVVTAYAYDVMKRPDEVVTQRGTNQVTKLTFYDGLGRTLETKRIGNDGSSIIQNEAAYDVLNRTTATTNALGGTTTSVYATQSNQQIISNTYYDGGTRIKTFYRDGSLQSLEGSAVQGMRYTNIVISDGGTFRSARQAIQLDASGNDTPDWTETVTDAAGRNYKTIYASAGTNYPFSVVYYCADSNNVGAAGLVTNRVDPDGVSVLSVYNAKGEQALSVIDVNQNGRIDWASTDRINFYTNYVTTDHSKTVLRTDQYSWNTSSSSSNLVTTKERSVDGLSEWDTTWNDGTAVTTSILTGYLGGGGRYETNKAADGSYNVRAYSYGQLQSITWYDANGWYIKEQAYGYDPQGRQNTDSDSRNGTTTYYFNNADQITGTVTPSPGGGQAAEVTSNFFDNLERSVGSLLPDGTYTTNLLNPTGLAWQAYGSREYPVGYGYDPQERMTKMTNWTAFPNTGARVTTWNYDPYRGWLNSKVYDDGNGPVYTNTAAGRLQTRLWARGTNASYGYNGGGDLASVSYSDSTANVGNGYDRLGRRISVTNGATVTSLTYNDAGKTVAEAYSGGPLNGWSVTNGYDAFLRRTNMVLVSNTTPMWTNIFTYDAASRLATVSDTANSAAYSYLTNASLAGQIVYAQNGTTRMTTTKQYDYLNRLTSIGTTNASGVTISSSAYAYNPANQRTGLVNADGSYWVYGYDSLGQVTSANKFWSDGTPVAGEQFGNAFDNIGNRTSTQTGGNANGTGLHTARYTANDVNQYTSRTVPGSIDILGTATNTATVTVNNQLAYRHGSFYESELPEFNANLPVWQSVTNLGVVGGTNDIVSNVTGSVFLPGNPENYSYDKDGNLTSDGRFTNSWDAENRLTNITSLSGGATGSLVKLDITYDYMGRRVQKIVSTNSGSGYVASYTNKFIYDGWNVIAILDGANKLLNSFVWGADLSGTVKDGSGAGGLISMTVYNGPNAGTYFYCYDGNGNASAVAYAASGNIASQYEYGPFGELLRASGQVATANPFRYSTQYQDDETSFINFGHRYYNASTGRWLSRDPIEEKGGLNLYGFVMNEPLAHADVRGLCQLIGPGAGVTHGRHSPPRSGVEHRLFAFGGPEDLVIPFGVTVSQDETNPARAKYTFWASNFRLIDQTFYGDETYVIASGDTYCQSVPGCPVLTVEDSSSVYTYDLLGYRVTLHVLPNEVDEGDAASKFYLTASYGGVVSTSETLIARWACLCLGFNGSADVGATL